MILLWILCLTLGLTTLNAKVLPDVGFYDVLVKHCPMLNMTNPPFKNQEVFQKCKSWHKINETKTLTDETKNNVLCLLYYDSLASLCTEMNTSKISNITINLVPDLKDYKIDKVCKKSALFPASRKLEHGLVKIINDEGICYKLCLNFDGSLVNECGLAYYFVNYNISQSITPSVVPSAQLEETNPNVIKSHSADKAPESASVDAPKPQQQATDVENKSEKTNQAPSTKDKPVIPQNNVSDREILSSNVVSANKNPPKQVPDVNTNKQSVAAVADEKISNSDVPKPATNEGTPVKDQPQSVEPQTKKDAPQEHSQVQPVPAETASEQNQQEPIPMVEQEQGGDNKGDTGLEDQQNALNREGQMMDDDEGLEDEESNGGKYKEDEKPANENVAAETEKKKEKPSTLTLAGEMPANYNTTEDLDGESYFFSYFMVICVLFVLGYVGYHNRQKVMALMLEGKRGKRQVRSRRPNSANYHKLDSNLEEAISSTCTKNSSHVIY